MAKEKLSDLLREAAVEVEDDDERFHLEQAAMAAESAEQLADRKAVAKKEAEATAKAEKAAEKAEAEAEKTEAKAEKAKAAEK